MTPTFWEVAVDAPLPKALTYEVPAELSDFARAGMRVTIPLGRRSANGILWNKLPNTVCRENFDFQIRPITSLDELTPAIKEDRRKWIEWLSNYYIYPLGETAALCYPPLNKQTKERKSSRPPLFEAPSNSFEGLVNPEKPILTDEQQTVFNSIRSQQNFSVNLVQGVTGSGKTEVYLRLLEEVINSENSQALVLVPEISLTPQLVDRFSKRFPNNVAVIHSHLTDREKTNQWWEMVESKKKILVGARSALFCPVPNLKLIILDEEHEPSFKQEESLRYHARDAAIVLAKSLNAKLVLGSATPSLETWNNCKSGKYHHHVMSHRVEKRPLPIVSVIDMRDVKEGGWLSTALEEEIALTLDRKKQVALFLNRRGMAPLVLCGACGRTSECPDCDVALTLHHNEHLVCHYCGYQESFSPTCKDCNESAVKAIGLGTEQIEKDIKERFPFARVARADRDEIQSREDLESIIKGMENREIDILVGTQMIAKGLDFENLDLVGVILADVGFNMPDFRSSERSFQILTQISGRAGRHVLEGQNPGKVIIQTFNPDHPCLKFVFNHDTGGFLDEELGHRQELGYPPFGKIALIKVSANLLKDSELNAGFVAERARQLRATKDEFASVEILGPCPSPLSKLRGKFRTQVLFKFPSPIILQKFVQIFWGDGAWLPKKSKVVIDIDPIQMM